MRTAMNKTTEIIDKCGKALTIHMELGIPLTTIYTWKDLKNGIPTKYRLDLIALAKSRGEIVKHEDFF